MRNRRFIAYLLLVTANVFAVPLHSVAAKEPLPRGWRKMRIGHVSFYAPPRLRHHGLPGNRGVVAAFSGEHNEPYFYYAYGPHVPCAESEQISSPRTEMVIDGKKAQLEFVVVPDEELLTNTKLRHTVTLCVLDVGDHKNKFEIYASSLDLGFLNAFKRSFDHTRFR
jgi:hypothetical protein